MFRSQPDESPPVELSVTLNQKTYRTGDALVAEVTLKNSGREVVDVPRFDASSLRFMQGEKGLHARVIRDPVYSKTMTPRSYTVQPGKAASRRFVFTRATQKPGSYALLVSLKRAIVGGELQRAPVYGSSEPYTVTEEVALERDPSNGLILKDQAIAIAKAEAPGRATRARAVLMPLGETGLFTWVVAMRIEEGEKAYTHTVQVDPYVGRVRPLKMKESPERESNQKDGSGAGE
jgi:hypothetical protein